MTQEDKELLLADLCSRLPYGVKIHVRGYKEPQSFYTIMVVGNKYFVHLTKTIGLNEIEEVKPYLRPMSSMIEEERKEFQNLCNEILFGCIFTPDRFDWLNAHHFDYRGLISKGLAIEAPEGMYGKEEQQ